VIKTKLAFGLIFFQAKKELERLISTLPEEILLIAVDGRLLGYPSEHSLSTDGSREVLQSRANTKIIDKPDVDQFTKRNTYFRQAKRDKIDLLMIVDSDHSLIGNWEMFYKDIENNVKLKNGYVYRMPIYTHGVDGLWRFVYINCLYFRPEKLHYKKRHDVICLNSQRVLGRIVINGVMHINDHNLRTQDRIAKGYIYKVLNRKTELNKMDHSILDIFKGIGY
jgi:hypothetical protein